jgi:hypothetical protein
LAYLDKKVHERYLLSPPWVVAAVNGFLVLSFLSRGLYQLATTFENFILADIPLQVLTDGQTTDKTDRQTESAAN